MTCDDRLPHSLIARIPTIQINAGRFRCSGPEMKRYEGQRSRPPFCSAPYAMHAQTLLQRPKSPTMLVITACGSGPTTACHHLSRTGIQLLAASKRDDIKSKWARSWIFEEGMPAKNLQEYEDSQDNNTLAVWRTETLNNDHSMTMGKKTKRYIKFQSISINHWLFVKDYLFAPSIAEPNPGLVYSNFLRVGK